MSPALPEPCRVGLVEDDRSQRESLGVLLDGQRGCSVVFAVGSAEEALARIEDGAPEVLVVDLGLPGMSGVELIRRLGTLAPLVETLVFTISEDNQSVFEALAAGASGYVTKDATPARLLDAVDELRAGGAPMSPAIARRVVRAFADRAAPPPAAPAGCILTTREREVLEHLAAGHSYESAAASLGLSTHTVHSHLRSVYKKLHVNSRAEAVYEAVTRNLVQLPRR